MYTVQRVYIWNWAKLCALFNIIGILIYAVIFVFIGFLGGNFDLAVFGHGSLSGFGVILAMVLLIGILSGLGFGALIAAIYNGLSKVFGPIEVEISFEPENIPEAAPEVNSQIQQT
ncbi:MAG: hypothetical protein WCT08_03425 [Patescibacteria group bacterium]|jgi:hypothetical protein